MDDYELQKKIELISNIRRRKREDEVELLAELILEKDKRRIKELENMIKDENIKQKILDLGVVITRKQLDNYLTELEISEISDRVQELHEQRTETIKPLSFLQRFKNGIKGIYFATEK